MYGPFLAIARKKRCSREIFRLGGAAWSGRRARRSPRASFLKRRRARGTPARARTPNARAPHAFNARRHHFSLALAHALVTVRKRCSAGARAGRLGAENTPGEEDRMANRITLAAATAGHSEGGTTLNAFDNALLVAGIGNINLIKVSSILPPEVAVI